MDALLILGGLLLILFGLVWLVVLAFGRSLFWGLASLFPPLTLWYVVRYWRTARKAVVLASLGSIPMVVGVVLLASNDPARLEEIVSLRWCSSAPQQPKELLIKLHGELNGEEFAPQYGELIDGVLTLREGQDFFARRELSIQVPTMADGSVRLNVLPTDAQPLPEVEISWLLPEQDLPEARQLNQGYTLFLDLKPVAPNKLQGDLHLVLPGPFKTALNGEVELFTNQLRYINGQVDRRFDSRDSITYVVEDYLQRRFNSRSASALKLPAFTLPANNLQLDVIASVDGELQQLPLQLTKTASKGWMVTGDHFADIAAIDEVKSTPPSVPDTVEAEPIRSTSDRRLRFSLERLQRYPEQYTNALIRVITEHGSAAQGRFVEFNPNGRIVLRRETSGPGEASYILRPAEISQIELLEP